MRRWPAEAASGCITLCLAVWGDKPMMEASAGWPELR